MLYAFGSRTIVFGFAHGVEQDLLHIVVVVLGLVTDCIVCDCAPNTNTRVWISVGTRDR